MLIMLFFSSFCCNELWEPRALSSPQPLPMPTPHMGDFPGDVLPRLLPFGVFFKQNLGLVFVLFRSLLFFFFFTSWESGCHAVTGNVLISTFLYIKDPKPG